MNAMSLHLVVPGDPDTKTGGYIYNRRVASELEALGWEVAVSGLEGRFPEADELALRSARGCLSALEDGAVVVMDGLALSAVPEVIAEHTRRLHLIGLVHLPLCDEGGLDEDRRRLYRTREAAALFAAGRIVVTSDFTARRLAELEVTADVIRVAAPGTDAAPLAKGSGGPGMHLLCAATVTPRKRHDVLLRALAGLKHLDWALTCAGGFDPTCAWMRKVFELVEESGLEDRVAFTGAKQADELSAAYDAADLFVLASEYESFGMVFTEALARGLPIVATTGGAIPETIPEDAGILLPPGDAAAFGNALAGLTRDTERFASVKSGAVAARDKLESWATTGQVFDAHLREFLAQ